MDDFEIVVSPSQHNVTIHYSTGFYSMVTVPAFSAIAINSSLTVGDFVVTCYDIIAKNDGTNARVNSVFYFRLSSNTRNNNPAKVIVHLHHTVRKVQVQGGAVVDNKKRAGVWFVENILLKLFSEASKDKAIDITKFNQNVKDMVDKHVETVKS